MKTNRAQIFLVRSYPQTDPKETRPKSGDAGDCVTAVMRRKKGAALDRKGRKSSVKYDTLTIVFSLECGIILLSRKRERDDRQDEILGRMAMKEKLMRQIGNEAKINHSDVRIIENYGSFVRFEDLSNNQNSYWTVNLTKTGRVQKRSLRLAR